MGQLTEAVLGMIHTHPFDDVDAAEARAIVDALALAVYADHEINDDEEIEINELVSEMQWSWADDLLSEGYVAMALTKAKEVVDDDGVAEAAGDIADVVDDGRYPYLFEMLARIVVADREVTYSETDFIAAFAAAFEMDPALAAEIVEDAQTERG